MRVVVPVELVFHFFVAECFQWRRFGFAVLAGCPGAAFALLFACFDLSSTPSCGVCFFFVYCYDTFLRCILRLQLR